MKDFTMSAVNEKNVKVPKGVLFVFCLIIFGFFGFGLAQ
jgi:hypothetical protein